VLPRSSIDTNGAYERSVTGNDEALQTGLNKKYQISVCPDMAMK
jgi:hypothetical protein